MEQTKRKNSTYQLANIKGKSNAGEASLYQDQHHNLGHSGKILRDI
jgi:hypothetical protein